MWPWGQKSVRWLHRRPRAPASVVRGVLTSGHGHSLAVVEAVQCSTHPDGHEVVATISTVISTDGDIYTGGGCGAGGGGAGLHPGQLRDGAQPGAGQHHPHHVREDQH